MAKQLLPSPRIRPVGYSPRSGEVKAEMPVRSPAFEPGVKLAEPLPRLANDNDIVKAADPMPKLENA